MQSIVPGTVAVLGLVSVMVFFESIFVCKKRGEKKLFLKSDPYFFCLKNSPEERKNLGS